MSRFKMRDGVVGVHKQPISFNQIVWSEIQACNEESGFDNVSKTVCHLCTLGMDSFRKKYCEPRVRERGEVEVKEEERKDERTEGQKLADAYSKKVGQSWKSVNPQDPIDGWTPV
jgi:hypothetical protein